MPNFSLSLPSVNTNNHCPNNPDTPSNINTASATLPTLATLPLPNLSNLPGPLGGLAAQLGLKSNNKTNHLNLGGNAASDNNNLLNFDFEQMQTLSERFKLPFPTNQNNAIHLPTTIPTNNDSNSTIEKYFNKTTQDFIARNNEDDNQETKQNVSLKTVNTNENKTKVEILKNDFILLKEKARKLDLIQERCGTEFVERLGGEKMLAT